MAKPAAPKTSNIAQRRRQAQISGDKAYSERRKNLLKAAGELFREKGFSSTSVNDLAEKLKIDRASLYYYTSGKEELFQEMVYEAALANVLMAESVKNNSHSTEEKITELVTSLIKGYETHYPYLHVYVQEDMTKIANLDTLWARKMINISDRFDAAVVAIVQDGLDNGTITPDSGSAKILASGIIGMCNWCHRWLHPKGKQSAEDIGKVYANTLLNGMCRQTR